MGKVYLVLTAVLIFLPACNRQPAGQAQRATIVMRDGTQMTGTITASTPSQVTLAGDDSVTRTIPMQQVRSIEYEDTAAAQAPPPAAPAPGVAAPGVAAPGAAAPAAVPADPVHDRHYHPQRAEIRTKTYELPAGTQLSVRTEETIDSARAAAGQTYAAEIARDVTDADGNVVIPRGSNAQIYLKSAARGGRIRGASDLVVDLRSVSVEGQEYQLETTDVAERGRSGVGANKRTAEFAGGGAAIGAIIGAIAGHGKGAAIGAGSGAGAGALTEILTKGPAVRIPAEAVLTFRLERPLRVVAAQ